MYLLLLDPDYSKKKVKQLQTVRNSCPYSVSILPMKSQLRLGKRFRDGEHWEYALTTKHNFTFVDNATLHNHHTRTRNHLHPFNAHGRIYLSITTPPLDTELLQLRSVDAFKSYKMRLMPVNVRFGAVPPNFHVNWRSDPGLWYFTYLFCCMDISLFFFFFLFWPLDNLQMWLVSKQRVLFCTSRVVIKKCW